ncbi:MAG: hypothetical protein HYZ14_08615 [Bacteroidetes bacterium]|nr:hypothetical protein [Bacteroidota bacterium]
MTTQTRDILFPDTEQKIRQRIRTGKNVDVADNGTVLVVSRVRRLPRHGLLRILIPRVQVKISTSPKSLSYKISPDKLAWFCLVVFALGIVVELAMDRQKFPRDYPPEFSYALFVYYTSMCIFEIKKTRRLFEEILAG